MLVVVVVGEDKGGGQRENERGVEENEGQKRKRGRRTSVGLQSMQRGGKPEYMKKTRAGETGRNEGRERRGGEVRTKGECVCVSNERQKWSGAFLCVAFLGCKPHGLGAMNECLCLPACLPVARMCVR